MYFSTRSESMANLCIGEKKLTLSKLVESWNRGKAGNGVELNEKIDICA